MGHRSGGPLVQQRAVGHHVGDQSDANRVTLPIPVRFEFVPLRFSCFYYPPTKAEHAAQVGEVLLRSRALFERSAAPLGLEVMDVHGR